jgi:hypothetical protein
MGISAEVVLDDAAAPEEVAAVNHVFEECGIQLVPHSRVYLRKSLDDLPPWIVYVVVTAPVQAYFVRLAIHAADATKNGIERWYDRVRAARATSRLRDGSIIVRHETTRIHVILPPGLPSEAFSSAGEP